MYCDVNNLYGHFSNEKKFLNFFSSADCIKLNTISQLILQNLYHITVLTEFYLKQQKGAKMASNSGF